MTPSAPTGRVVLVFALAAVLGVVSVGRASAGDAPPLSPADVLGRIRSGLESSDASERKRAFDDVDDLVARDPAAAQGVLASLRDVLRRRGGAERARVVRRLLAIPGDESLAAWWGASDPARETDERVLLAAVDAVGDRKGDVALARRLVARATDPKEERDRRALAIEEVALLDSPAVRLVLDAPRRGADWVEESCRALALGRRGGLASVPPLLVLLDAEAASPRVHAWESLVRVTHQNLPCRRAAWDAWWAADVARREGAPSLAAAATTRGAPAADPYAAPEPAHVPRYYGLPLKRTHGSSHVVFCLDVSASMSEHGIEPARAHLKSTLLEMTTADSFDVVAFNDRVTTFAGRLARAHPIGKARAIAWLDAIVPKAYTNLYDAVETAFQYAGRGRDPSPEPTRLDAVFVLSDGLPNRGRYLVHGQVVAGIAALSERRTPVHTIGVGGDAVFALLRDVAQATGGTFVAPED